MEDAFRHIEAHAALGGLKYAQIADLQDLRFWPLRRYPYLIFYFERVDHIDVWRVLHASRDVPSWITSPTID
ncbi:type II toxin-antitoxin system RelE/ParE family toxin [Pelagibacterium luteolum]|uniref:type II toxin-antitoxin system RelE/ParE family toxin n=1 Tax=Pelagibacterium luteolum TaxID=440168 RepID=UPI001AECD6A9